MMDRPFRQLRNFRLLSGLSWRVLALALFMLGGLGVLLFALSWVPRDRRGPAALLLAGSLLGLGFSLYLTYIEAFVLATWCILCVASLGLILGISVLAALRLRAAGEVGVVTLA